MKLRHIDARINLDRDLYHPPPNAFIPAGSGRDCQDVEQPFKRANKRISCREGKMGVVGEMISRACSLQFTAAPVFVLEILSPCIVLSDKLFLG